MHLANLKLINFKNYQKEDFSFTPEINCFVGDNGAGKTNLLDAIHYLSLTKSFLNSIDYQNLKHGKDFFSLLGTYMKDQTESKVKCQLKAGEKKMISLNNNYYDKLSEHIGLFPLVLIAPYDTDIIRGSNDIRRKYFDGVMAQLDKQYLDDLIVYNHALRQRNYVLRYTESHHKVDMDLIEPYDQILLSRGQKIYKQRKEFLKSALPSIQEHYNFISDHKEHIRIKYRSDVDSDNYEIDFKHSLRNDLAAKRTHVGIHKDTYKIEIDGYPINKFGSQGQQKSLIVSLKLAQFDILRNKNGFKPIILMDDIFDKLDEHRINKILNLVAGHTFGQIFITDARPERSVAIFENIRVARYIYEIKDGCIVQVKS